MSRWTEALACALALVAVDAAAFDRFPGVGRAATPAEIAAWDIDVRPDFLGLPKGGGSAARGQDIWDAKCAACHGTFGESNRVFPPLVGGTTTAGMASGRVENLKRPDYPHRTTMMKVPTVSTLFDYIRRAMPWDAPKSLTVDEVYAVLAYMLNLADVVPEGFVLDDRSIRQVQARMPNREGMTTGHALWFGAGFGKPPPADTANTACMTDCREPATPVSTIPASAKGSYGDLARQHRGIGPVRGVETPP
ncbi:MAG: cytochrome c [Rhodospirillales bacterium]|nr:cytochrome c [Rhodospirillales bacterium]